MKDPDSGNLDRVQIIKVSTKNGKSQEKILRCAVDRRPQARSEDRQAAGGRQYGGREEGYLQKPIGSAELIGQWTDAEFDPGGRDLLRSACWRFRRLAGPPIGRRSSACRRIQVAATVQQRAWTSPIWYTPPGERTRAYRRRSNRMLRRAAESVIAKFAPVLTLALLMLTCPAQAQTFSVIHNFFGGSDGASPQSGLTVDNRGNLYGTAGSGGDGGGGTVFKMVHQGSGWIFLTLYSFDTRLTDNGIAPEAAVVIGSNGSLYGTTEIGGVDGQGCDNYGCGLVYNLRPPARATASALGQWTETVLYAFTGSPDGAHPEAAVVFDQAGNIYGTTLREAPATGALPMNCYLPMGAGPNGPFTHSPTETTADISREA